MALPAGRYGVTKNQLLKIKKLPMNTIKLIEDLYEKYSLLGSAAFKNSTSVVTESTDLVESGAVYIALQGKADNSVIGTVEDGTNPTKSYSVGEHFIRNGKFCTVTVAVTTSSTWSEGSNYTSGAVGDVVYLRLDSSVSVSAGSFANVDFDSNIPFSSYDILGVSIQIAGSGGSANAVPRWVSTSQANVRIVVLNLDSSNGYTWGVSVLLIIRVK